jgi:hypothetical protein
MGRKDKSFAAKLGVNKEDQKRHCSKCGETFSYVNVIDSEMANKGAWKFREKFVGVCKCNQKEVYG